MRLLTEEEYVSWYEERAAANGTSLEDELGKTEDLLRGIEPEQTTSTQRMKAKEEEALEKKKEEILKAREPLPRLVHLCAAADGEGASGVSEEDFMDELDSLSDQMTAEDLEFVASRGVYPAVKKFAREKLESL